MRIGRPAEPARTIDSRDNAITPLRLGLALLVVFSHAFPISGLGRDGLGKLTGQMELGTVAVIAFFGLSGYLLARSRMSSSLSRYAARRALRILPGLYVCLLALALVAAPLAAGLGGGASPAQVGDYVRGVATFQPLPVDIAGFYPKSAVGNIVDAPLWTLPWEVYLYGMLGVVGIGGQRLMRTVCPVLLVLFAILNAMTRDTALDLYGHLPVAFLAGSCAFMYRIPFRVEFAAVVVAITVGATVLNVLGLVGPMAIPYLALYVGMRLPLRWTFDMSFGVYIYGWPVQSLLAQAGATPLGPVLFFLLTTVIVLPIAALSACFIEMPALGLAGRAKPATSTSLGRQVASDIGQIGMEPVAATTAPSTDHARST